MSGEETNQRLPIHISERGLALKNFDDMFRFSEVFVKSGLALQGDTAAKVMIKLQAGLELGFQPMQALQTLFVTDKGRLSMMAVGMLALIRRSNRVRNCQVVIEGTGDQRKAVLTAELAGYNVRVDYSVDDAKMARLWGKRTQNGYDTPWITSPDDMLIARVISRASKRYFSDIILGIEAEEVARDIEDDPSRGVPETNPRIRGTVTVEQPAVLRPQLESPKDTIDPLFASLQNPEPLTVPAVKVNSDGAVEPA